jgi:hypothetical protein
MSKVLTVAVVETGLIHPDVLSEMMRWGLPIDIVEAKQVVKTSDEVVERIQEALEGEDLVRLRDTDLDIIRYYLAQQRPGVLHVEEDQDNIANFSVHFCKTKLGEYVIPWRSEGVYGFIVDEKTYLTFQETNSEGKKQRVKVHFRDVRELFFGDTKAFMVCVPVEE